MHELDIEPDHVIITTLYLLAAMLARSCYYHHIFQQKNCVGVNRLQQYGYVVDLLARAGLINDEYFICD